MATGLPGYNISPLNYTGKDGIFFHLKDDMSVFLKLSATPSMRYTAPYEASTQPVQSGQTITDNVQEKPKTISIEGVVVVGYEGAFFTSKDTTVVEDFINTLHKWRQQKQILRVICKDGISIENAFCTEFEATKDTKIVNGLNISLTFQDINFVVQIGRTNAPNTQNANGSKDGAKTKTSGVAGKKDVGKAGTVKTAPRTVCQITKQRLDQGDTAPWLTGAMGGCLVNAKVSASGKIIYDEAGGAKYIPNGIYGSQGGNVNKIPGKG